MIYRLECGSWGSYSTPLITQAILQGPDGFDVDGLWKTYEKAMSDAVGPPPNGDAATWKAWKAKVNEYKATECAKYGVDSHDGYCLTNCFVAMLVKDHGFTSLEFDNVNTEEG